jgi:hypothetical protein
MEARDGLVGGGGWLEQQGIEQRKATGATAYEVLAPM